MTPDIEKIEHLLNAKAFTELTPAERELVLAHLSGAEEYEHMRDTLVRVKKVFVTEAAALSVDADLKEQILMRFEQNRAHRPSWTERAGIFLQTLIPSPAGRFAGALTLLLAIVSVVFFVWPEQQPEMARQLFPPATEPQIVTLTDTTPPIDEAIEHTNVIITTSPVEAANLAVTETDRLPAAATYDREAGDDQNEFIAAGYSENEWRNKDAANGSGNQQITGVESSAKLKAGEQSPPVYKNQEGLLQYQNNRVADAGIKSDTYSDAYKNYTPPAGSKKETESRAAEKTTNTSLPQKPAVTGNTRDEERLEETVVTARELKQRSNGTVNDAMGGATYTWSADKASSAPVPVWPGVEGQSNPYASTLESMKAFFGKETGTAYRAVTQEMAGLQKSKTARLSLTFNAHGIITKVHVSGDVNEAQKKALIQRALQLPAFRFTSGTGKPLLEQTYVLELY